MSKGNTIRIGVIDLGTNSIRFDVYEVSTKGARRICREKEMIRLGDSVFSRGSIDKRAKERAFKALFRYCEQAKELKVSVLRAVATSALREAKNRQAFLDDVKKKTGLRIQVISGLQEAKLIAEGVLSAFPKLHGRFVTVDIGGGSTEISWGKNRRIERSISLPLGVARVTREFFTRTSLKNVPERYLEARSFVRAHLLRRLSQVDRSANLTFIGSSGTVRAFAVIEKEIAGGGKRITRKFLRKIMSRLVKLPSAQIRNLPGMDPKRVDLMLAGGAILEEFMDVFEGHDLKVSECSLREGLFRRELQRLQVQKSKRKI